MTRPALSSRVAAAFVFAALSAPAFAQGTAEQREACTPDAIKLCSDTIPDIDKTKACMQAHEAELSPRCRAVFTAGDERQPGDETPAVRTHKRRIARAPLPDDEAPVERPPGVAPDDDFPDAVPRRFRAPDPDETADGEDTDRARAVIGHLCDDDMIDPRTCAVTERALGGR